MTDNTSSVPVAPGPVGRPPRGGRPGRHLTERNPAWGTTPGGDIASHAFLVIWALITGLPLIWVLLASSKTNREITNNPFGFPGKFRPEAFVDAWQTANIGQFFINSLIVVVCGVTLTMILSSMTAYVLGRYRFLGSRIVYYLFLVGMTFPLFLAIVPLRAVVEGLGLFQNKPGLILVYVAFSLPFSVFFLTAFFQSLPSELAEAAFLDGAGHFRTFFQVMLPLAKPGLISIGVFNFLGQWNQYLLPLVLNPQVDDQRSNFLLTQGLAELAQRTNYESTSTSAAAMFAGLVIAMVPVLVVYILFQRRVEEGLTAGALK